jgi:multidrug efflux pump subunit AcrA (membrane-fusion protein)
MRQVRLGDHFDDRIEILSGLVAGDRIALDPLAAMQALPRISGSLKSGS